MNIKALIGKKIAVHCDTKEKANAFLKECEAEGILWAIGLAATENNMLYKFGENTCYSLKDDEIRFMTKQFYLNENYNIIKYSPTPTPPKNKSKVEVRRKDDRINIKIKLPKLSINAFAKDVHKTAAAHGWWEKEPSFAEIIALCHSELSEALEEYRKDGDVCYYLDGDGDITTDMTAYKGQELHGTGVELADCILRILDYCAAKDIDIENILRLKNEFNKNRPYKHGGKKI